MHFSVPILNTNKTQSSSVLKTTSIVFIFFFNFFPVVGQKVTDTPTDVEYGIRVLRTSKIIRRDVAFLTEDYGVHYFDGFFARFTRNRKSLRLGVGFYSNGYIFPYYEKKIRGLEYTDTQYLQLYGGI